MYSRYAMQHLTQALADTPVVLVQGPRQVGKTTLVKQLLTEDWAYVTLDNGEDLTFAKSDPVRFIRGRDRLIIDEVQKAPELFSEIKQSVDEDRRPGRFILTGSAKVLLLPTLSDSLVGRMEIVDMLPLSQFEISGIQPSFLEHLFEANPKKVRKCVVDDELIKIMLTGGFPESISRKKEARQRKWAESYLQTIIMRDLRDIADVNNLIDLPRFLMALAASSGQLINFSKLGNSINVSYKTGQRYLALLEQLFLISRLKPWYSNKMKQIVKSPKLHFLDSGILGTVLNVNGNQLNLHQTNFGMIAESFVYTEVLKLVAASENKYEPYFFRGANNKEVDIVLERSDGKIVGLEVKSSASVSPRDFSGLRELAKIAGSRFKYGVVLYNGTRIRSVEDNLISAPISSLWL